MTEEIIIDGVNVAGCEYYKGKCMEYTHYCQIGCKECTDIGTRLCHYKQTERFKAKIARLEQENKELKIYIESNKQQVEEVETLVMDNDRLLQENEELKHRCEVYHQCDEMIKNTYGQAHKEAMELTQENTKLKEENERLKEQLSGKTFFCENCEKLARENERLKEEISIAKENYGLEMEFQNMYRKALEEIRNYLNTLSSVDSDFVNTETYLRIQNKISEVLR